MLHLLKPLQAVSWNAEGLGVFPWGLSVSCRTIKENRPRWMQMARKPSRCLERVPFGPADESTPAQTPHLHFLHQSRSLHSPYFLPYLRSTSTRLFLLLGSHLPPLQRLLNCRGAILNECASGHIHAGKRVCPQTFPRASPLLLYLPAASEVLIALRLQTPLRALDCLSSLKRALSPLPRHHLPSQPPQSMGHIPHLQRIDLVHKRTPLSFTACLSTCSALRQTTPQLRPALRISTMDRL